MSKEPFPDDSNDDWLVLPLLEMFNMTKDRSPLDEMLEAAFREWDHAEIMEAKAFWDLRTATIHVLWDTEIAKAPPGALDGPDGLIMSFPDFDKPEGSFLEYHKITYGQHQVIECEGIVVCRL